MSNSFDTPYGLGGALIGSGNDLPPIQPPIVKSPANPHNKDTVRAVVDMVNGTPGTDSNGNVVFTDSTMATLLIENEFPAESGYTIPANLGQTIQMAPNPLPSQPTAGVMYVNNPQLNEGGSWVTANRKTREIVSLDTGISTSAPVDYSNLFQDIRHDGAFNPKGFQDPPPIGQPHCQKMPDIVKNTGPIIDSATVPEPQGIDGSVYDLVATFVLDPKQADYQETGQTWGGGTVPIWFQGMKFYRRLTSNPANVVEVADMGFEGDLTWTQAVEVGANNTYDLGIAFLDLSNRTSKIVWPAGSSDLIMPPLGGQNVGGLENLNLLSDSQFSNVRQGSVWTLRGNQVLCAHMTYWTDDGIDFPTDTTCAYLKGSSPNGANNFMIQHNQKDGVDRYVASEFVDVASGFVYTASCYIDASQLADGKQLPLLTVHDATGKSFWDGPKTDWPLLASVAQADGGAGRVQVQWTDNNPSITQVVIVLNGHSADCNFLVFSQPQFEYGDHMTSYKPTTGLTKYGPPSQQGGSQPPKDVEVTMTNKSFTHYDNNHFTYGCDCNFTISIDPDPSRWLDRATLVYCAPGTYDPDNVSGYPVCGIVHPDQFPLGDGVSKKITCKIHSLPNGERWDIYLVLYDGTGKARYKDGQGAWLVGETLKQGKQSQQNDDPQLQATGITLSSYNNVGSTYGATLSFTLSAGLDPADWSNGAKLFYVPTGTVFDPNNVTGYPSCAHLPSTALVPGETLNIPFHGLACGQQFDLYLVLTDTHGQHHVVSNPAITGGPTYGGGATYGSGAVYGPSQVIATTANQVISRGQVIGPVIAKAHLKGTSSTDYTTAIVDGSNNLIHAIMSTPTQAVLAASAGSDGLYLNSNQINDRHINSVKLDTINDGTTYARVKSTELSTGTVKQLNDGTNVRTAAQVTTVVAGTPDSHGSYLALGCVYDGHIGGVKLDTISDGTSFKRVAAADITSGHVTKTGATGSFVIKGVGDTNTLSLDTEIVDGTTYARPKAAGMSSGFVTKTGASGAFVIKGVGDTNTLSLDNEIVDGAVYGRVRGSELHLGTVKQLNDGTLIRTATAIGLAIDNSSNILNTGWGSGSKLGTDGSLSGFSNTGTASQQLFTLGNGQIVEFEAQFKLPSNGDTYFLLGNMTNGYGLKWNATTGSVTICKISSGTVSTLGVAIATIAQDTNLHSFRVSVTVGASVNIIEASFDGMTPVRVPDVSSILILTTGTWGFTITDNSGGGMKVWGFDSEGANQHYSTMPAQFRTAINISSQLTASIFDGAIAISPSNITTAINTSGQIIGSVFDSISGVALTPQHITDVIGINSGRGRVNVNPPGGVVGNMPYSNLPSAATTAFDLNGNIKANMFGSGSGVTQSAANGSLAGFPVGGASTVSTFPAIGFMPITICALIKLGATGNTGGLYWGDTNQGVGLEWSSSGAIQTVQYISGSRGVIETLPNSPQSQDTLYHSFIITVNYNPGSDQATISAQFDDNISPNNGKGGITTGFFAMTSFPVTVLAGGVLGQVQNLSIAYENTAYLKYNANTEYGATLAANSDANGSYIRPGQVFADQIKWASGTPTGAVSLDSVPDGTSFKRVAAADITSGHVTKTGSTGSFVIKGVGDANALSLDNDVADGTTYARIKAQNLNGGNLGTMWNSTAIYEDSAGRYAGFVSATQYSSTDAYPIKASFPWTFSGCMVSGGSTANIFAMIGNQTNGIGFRWNTSGVVALAVFKAGTGTFTTIATITRDTAIHWFSVKVTPGATPGTTDAYVIFFDTSTLAGSTGTTAVTWGSTANTSVQLSNSGSLLSQIRISSSGA